MPTKQLRSHITTLCHGLPNTEIQFIDYAIELSNKLLQPLLKEYDRLVASSFEERICAISCVLYNQGTLQAWLDGKLWGEDVITPTLPTLEENETRQGQLRALLCQIKEVIENKETRIVAFSEDVNDDTIWDHAMKDKSQQYIESNIVPVLEEHLQRWIQEVDRDVNAFLKAMSSDTSLKEACFALGVKLTSQEDMYHTVVCNDAVGELLQDMAMYTSDQTKLPRQAVQSLQALLAASRNLNDAPRTVDEGMLMNRVVSEIKAAIKTYIETGPKPHRGTRVCDFWDQSPVVLYATKLSGFIDMLEKNGDPHPTNHKRDCDVALSVDLTIHVNGKKMRLSMIGDHEE